MCEESSEAECLQTAVICLLSVRCESFNLHLVLQIQGIIQKVVVFLSLRVLLKSTTISGEKVEIKSISSLLDS